MRTDLKNNISIVPSLLPAARTEAADGTGVDLANFDAVQVVIHAGTLAGTNTPTFTFEVQESDDNSTFAAVADADLDGTEPAVVAANDEQLHEIGYKGGKRYLRVSLKTVAGTNPSLPCAATVIRAGARKYPI